MNQIDDSDATGRGKRHLRTWMLIGLALLGAYLLIGHWTHVSPYVPILIFLSCPLMHLLMHRGHGRHRHGGDRQEPPAGR